MRYGLTLANRGVLFGATSVSEMLQMAEIADSSEVFTSVWVGDSLIGKPRLESISLLSAIAGRTKRVLIGTACMASFPLRDPVLLAYQWATLDVMAEGRTVMVPCTGIIQQEGGQIEGRLYGLQPKDRVSRMIEWITILKLLWTQDNVAFEGEHYRFSGITIDPKPAAQPRPPIWIANNAKISYGPTFGIADRSQADNDLIERQLRRVIEHADGWQTAVCDPEDLAWRLRVLRNLAVEVGRNPDEITTQIYFNINVNEDRQSARDESKRFLDTYYTTDLNPEFIDCWVATGSPKECVEQLMVYERLGFDEIAIRITGWDQLGQIRRVVDEVLPLLASAAGRDGGLSKAARGPAPAKR